MTGGNDGTARLWDIEDRQRSTPVQTYYHSDELRSLSIIPDDYLLETEGDGNKGKYKVRSVSVSPDGGFLVTAGNDSTAKLWNLRDLKQTVPAGILEGGHTHPITAVHISPDGNYVATGSVDTLVQLWDLKTQKAIRAFSGESVFVNAAAMSRDGKYLAAGQKDNAIKIWDLAAGKLSKTFYSSDEKWNFTGFVWGVTSLDFSQDNKHLVSGSTDGLVKLWDVGSGQTTIRDIKCHYYINSVRLSQDDKFIAYGGFSPIAGAWNTGSEALEASFNVDTPWVGAVDIHTEKGYLAAAGDHPGNGKINSVVLWDLNSKEKLHEFHGHSWRVRTVRISKDGKHMVSGSNDNTACVWNLDNRDKAPLVLRGHSSWVISVDISADGAYVVTGSDDGTAKLWDGKTGRELKTFSGHKAGVVASISDDAQYLVTGSKDSSCKIWDLQSGKELATLISIGEEDWAVLTPSGLFDASPGAMLNTFQRLDGEGPVRWPKQRRI